MTTPEQAPAAAAPAAPAATGNITFEDVRIALGETDPDETNAGKIRKIIGRGSNQTIQTHLDSIRKARAPALPGTQAPPPPAPKDIVEAIWSAAWAASQAKTYGRTELLAAERDAALRMSTTRASEIQALNADVDTLQEKITIAEENAAALTVKAEADLAAAARAAAETAESLARVTEEKAKAQADAAHAAEQAAADAAKMIEQLKTEKAKVVADAAHAAQLATRDATIADNVMQGTINKLTDKTVELKSQVEELKSLLRSTMTPVPAPAPAPAATTAQGGVK